MSIRASVKNFLRWNVVDPLARNDTEIIYQQIFFKQCAEAGIKDTFFPVGGAANHGLMYLLLRILRDHDVRTIVELGSGQSTILIDRAKRDDCTHICYEDSLDWHQAIGSKLLRCDYRHRGLTRKSCDGVEFDGYEGLEPVDFDLLLVDGPTGTAQYSRFDAIELIKRNKSRDFVIIFDDGDRPGERQTIKHALTVLRAEKHEVKLKDLVALKTQTVITCGRFRPCSYYY